MAPFRPAGRETGVLTFAPPHRIRSQQLRQRRSIRQDAAHLGWHLLGRLIGRHAHGLVDVLHRKLDDSIVLFLAKDDADGRIFLR